MEATLVLIPILFASGFIIEATRIQQIKNIARLALYEAGRSASVSHADPKIYEEVFKRNMLALHVPQGSHSSAKARQHFALRQQVKRTGLPAWRLKVLAPTKASFQDFANRHMSNINNKPTIRNDYLIEQHQKKINQGWAGGQGPHSGQTIFQANTLEIELSYFHEPLLPGMQAVLRLLSRLRKDDAGQAWSRGLFAIVITHSVMMQSDLMDWW